MHINVMRKITSAITSVVSIGSAYKVDGVDGG